MLTLRSLLVLSTLLLSAPVAVALTQSGAVRVVDGDSLELGGEKIRLFGIDAPERGQSCDRNGQTWECGAWSAAMLARAVQAGQVTCTPQDRDRFGRTVAICHAGKIDLGQAQVRAGAAQAYVRYSDRYLPDQAKAQTARAGVWAGRMVTPEAHRHPVAQLASEPARHGCAIKGNINGPSRIYHMPGQRDYDATRITPEKGEAWFCSESDAKDAGFRPARR
ncbi:MAG: thermonuclease family protein [Rhodobacteraceae bacterium]|nr:thermonuclease family protein [Paracoccaceae bacterium]